MLQDWERGLIGNNPGTVSRLPTRMPAARVIIRALAGRRARTRALELPSAA